MKCWDQCLRYLWEPFLVLKRKKVLILIRFSLVIPVEPSPEGFVPGPAIHFQSRQKRTLFFTHQVLAFHLGLMVLQCHIHRIL